MAGNLRTMWQVSKNKVLFKTLWRLQKKANSFRERRLFSSEKQYLGWGQTSGAMKRRNVLAEGGVEMRKIQISLPTRGFPHAEQSSLAAGCPTTQADSATISSEAALTPQVQARPYKTTLLSRLQSQTQKITCDLQAMNQGTQNPPPWV